MSREIKFRAWDLQDKKMWGWKDIVFGMTSANDLFNTPHLIPMQYTGLRDRNGVEIYEGDIVRTPLYGRRDCEVVFMKAGFYLLLDTGIGTNLYPMTDIDMEIIGNVFENPNLLESKDE